MRKLTVKNFSVIQDADLEFGKITVLIGPQASGKSLLCKLAYFLGPNLTEIIAEFAAQQRAWSYLEEFALIEFRRRFPEVAWGTSAFLVEYEQERFGVKVVGERSGNGPHISISFSEGIKAFYTINWPPRGVANMNQIVSLVY